MESLYRKYRPQTYASMVGQEHIVSTLANALTEGRVSHAYLFSGPRGTGKTTTARLLAKALLCEHGPTAEPCGECDQCRQVADGTHPDVYELDAASRTGVENVRAEIINRVGFAPVSGRYKVYIIDEVHMFTDSAFNALLKTIEEPPEHVVFILCTTDPQDVPETILSRVQRLEFHCIGTPEIAAHLAHVCDMEGFSYDMEAIRMVARHARGGMRDALSTLEQLSVYGKGSITLDDAQAVLGEVASDMMDGVVKAIADRDCAACFNVVAELIERGGDPVRFSHDLVEYLRDIFVCMVAGPDALKEKHPDGVDGYAALASRMGPADRMTYLLDVMSSLGSELKYSTDQRLSLEVALVRMARPSSELTLEALATRIADLEVQLETLRTDGVPMGSPAGSAPQATRAVPAPAEGFAPRPVAPAMGRPIQDPVPARPEPARPESARPEAHGGTQDIPSFNRFTYDGSPAPKAAPTSAPAPKPAPAPMSAPKQVAPPAPTPMVAAKTMPAPVPVPTSAPAATPAPSLAPAATAAPAPAPVSGADVAGGSLGLDDAAIRADWAKVKQRVVAANPRFAGIWPQIEPSNVAGRLHLRNLGAPFVAMVLGDPANIAIIARAASEVWGHDVQVEFEGASAPSAKAVKPAAPAAAFALQGTPAPASKPASTPTPAPKPAPAPSPVPAPKAPAPATPVRRSATELTAAIMASVQSAAPATDGDDASAESAPAPEPGPAARQAPATDGDSSATFPPENGVGFPEPDPFDYVPDDQVPLDVYDAPAPSPAPTPSTPARDIPPWEVAPAPAPSPAPVPAAPVPASHPAGTSCRPSAPRLASQEPHAIAMSQMLSEAFGGYVKVSAEQE